MLHFDCDYMEGCCPEILQRLIETNMEQTSGYGEDPYTRSAKEKIRQAIGCPEAEVHLLVGGTHTNATVIDSLLRPYQGVLAATSAHINVHEAGIIEACGHKVLTLPQHQGKIQAENLSQWLRTFYGDVTHNHMVEPGMVYLSFPTELGTLYTKAELEAIHNVCLEYNLPLYIDGARLGYGLASPECDITLQELPTLCDAFYIGGTKVGALFGEAVVFPKNSDSSTKIDTRGFFTQIKRHGALLAKGRLLGLQFDTLFTDNLYLRLGQHAIQCALRVKEILRQRGLTVYLETPTNQQFYLMSEEELDPWRDYATFDLWERLPDGRFIVRFATSWATRLEDIELLATF